MIKDNGVSFQEEKKKKNFKSIDIIAEEVYLEEVAKLRKKHPEVIECIEIDAKNKFIRNLFGDKQSLTYEDWTKKYPYYAKWLEDNGFVYNKSKDKGQNKSVSPSPEPEKSESDVCVCGHHAERHNYFINDWGFCCGVCDCEEFKLKQSESERTLHRKVPNPTRLAGSADVEKKK
jgi:hypothetical protein